MSDERKAGPIEGEPVIYVDEFKREHQALVTANWGAKDDAAPSLNLVIVSRDENKTDTYGRQIQRETSVVHLSHQSAQARCWKRVGE